MLYTLFGFSLDVYFCKCLFFFLQLLSVVPDYVKYFLISVRTFLFLFMNLKCNLDSIQLLKIEVINVRSFSVSSQVNDKSFTNASALWYCQFVSDID